MKNKKIIESIIDSSKLYFHGSASKKFDLIHYPSYEHPFYVTTDIKYAAAFATKRYSSTGLYNDKISFAKSDDETYVYVISMNGTAKFLDFRNTTLDSIKEVKEFKEKCIPIELYPIFDDLIENIPIIQQKMESGLIDFGLDIFILCDELLCFCRFLSHLVIRSNLSKQDIINKLCEEIDDNNSTCKITYGAAPLFNKDSAKNHIDILIPIVNAAIINAKFRRFLVEIDVTYEPHALMKKFFEILDRNGYSGIITAENDNNEYSGIKVYTNYAIGIWNINAFDNFSAISIPYSQLVKSIKNIESIKSINSTTANNKILKLIKEYKKSKM